jgi:flagellar secretion chaperone FliS
MNQDPTPENIAAASPDMLTLMLFQGAVRFGGEAQQAIASGDTAAGAHLVGRVRAIVQELQSSLNLDAGPIGGHLAAIYDYLLRRLDVAMDDPAALSEVIDDLDDLGRTWGTLVESRQAEGALASA